MTKREQVQNDALNTVIKYQRAGLALSVGVGKTLVGLNYIDYFFNQNSKLKVLLVSPTLTIINNWKNEIVKFKKDYLLSSIEFTTYRSINKHDNSKYDVVILEEAHNLLDSHLNFLGHYTGRILGLTGTPPRYQDSEKGRMVNQFCPMKFTYITDDAIDDDILNDYRIIVHMMNLSTQNTIPVNLKDKSFFTSERKNYDFWSDRLDSASSPKQRQITAIMRMRALMGFKTKEDYVKKLLNNIEDKCLVFANTQDQADELCMYSVHSNNPDSELNLINFKEGVIDKLSCVMQLNEGVNIPNLRAGIIMHAYGNERKANQRIGRLLRLNPDEIATVHVLCYRNTIDEKWVQEGLKDLDQLKIRYFDVKQ